jgi:hypothetical protein
MAEEKSGETTSDKSTGSPVPGDFVNLEKQVKAIQSLIDDIDTAAERSVVGEIDNLTDRKLTLIQAAHEFGGFSNRAPDFAIEPRKAGLFGSKNKNPLQGTVGRVEYRAEDGTEFVCGWSNPFIGSGTIRFVVRGAHPARYDVFATAGGGNKGAIRRWVIFPLNGPFSVLQFLRHRGVKRVLELEGAKGGSLRQLMGL